MELFQEVLSNIENVDYNSIKLAWERLDSLAKPIGSLGTLEEIAAKISGITGGLYNEISRKSIIVMCADNGICEEGVSSCPQGITAIVTNNFIRGITGVCVLAKKANSDLTVIDIGINEDIDNPKVINKKLAYGTQNMTKGPAMTREEVIQAIEIGIEVVGKLKNEGYNLLGTGEMGIGNTSTSSAVLSVLSGLTIEEAAGKGAGLTEEQFENKKRIIKKAIDVNMPDKEDVLDVISKVGGFDIAGLCGCFLGAAYYKVPMVIDGFISSTAALCAYKLNPLTKEYMIPSHLSAEPGAEYVMKKIGLEPILNLKMRLGEGSGCPLAFSIIESALYMMNNMATFQEAEIEDKFYIDIR